MFWQFFWKQKLSRELQPLIQENGNKKICSVLIEAPSIKRDRVAALVEADEGEVLGELKIISSITAKVPAAALAEMASSRFVKKIWKNSPVYALQNRISSPESVFKTYQWESTGKGVVVAVLDTGISPHRDLMLPENRIIGWKDMIYEQTRPYDDHGHGTYMAGIIAGNGHTSHGKIRGMAPEAELVGVKVLTKDGSGELADLITGIEWCLDHSKTFGIKVLNLSLGTTAQSVYWLDPLCRAATSAWKNGLVVCAAAGETTEGIYLNSPGINPNLITIGSSDQKERSKARSPLLGLKKRLGLSHFAVPDLIAPGADIPSIKVGSGYALLSGSSVATSWVSGGTALILGKWPDLSPHRIKRLLIRNANDDGLEKYFQGAGLANLESSLGKTSTRIMSVRRNNEIARLSLAPESLWFKVINFVKDLDLSQVKQIIKLFPQKNEGAKNLNIIKKALDFAEQLNLKNLNEIIGLFRRHNNEENSTSLLETVLNLAKSIDLAKLSEVIGPLLKNNDSIKDLVGLLFKAAPFFLSPNKMD